MIFKRVLTSVLVVGLMAGTFALAGNARSQATDLSDVTNRVRRALAGLPYYGVFDNLEFTINEGVVTLTGQVVRPVTKQDAESRAKRVKGVESVINNIEVLPLVSSDSRLRRVLYRTIFSTAGMWRYRMGVNPSIHIIVNNGHVTLVGVVSSEQDKELAGIKANSVPGIFSVENKLRVEGKNQ